MAYESVHLENSIAIENHYLSPLFPIYERLFPFQGKAMISGSWSAWTGGEIIAVAGDRRLALKKGHPVPQAQ